MKKFSRLIAIGLVISNILVLGACGKQATFNGSKTGDANHFDIDFETLNTSYSYDLEMKAGESIDVSVEKQAGDISITIQKGDEKPIYRGNNMESTDFKVGINEEGTYTLTVSGDNAKGHVVMTKEQAEQDEVDTEDTAGEVVTSEEDTTGKTQEEDTAGKAKGEDAADKANEDDTSAKAKGEGTTGKANEGDASAKIKEEDKTMKLYDQLIKKILSGKESLSDEAESYSYSDATAPGYALYDIDKDGICEFFVTTDIKNLWHTYAVYYIKDGKVTYGALLNGYMPKDGLWTFGFDFYDQAYKYTGSDGFVQVWELTYPFEDETYGSITYEGKESKDISLTEINELLADESIQPDDITWEPLTESTTLTGKIEESILGDKIVEKVTWNNGQDEYDYNGGADTEFSFHMSDGTVQVLSAKYNPMITGMEMVDIDNDGIEEYILNASFANTTGEYAFLYAFKFVDGNVIQLYPTTDIPIFAEETWPRQTRGDLSNTSIVTVEKDGKTLNALEVSLIEKVYSEEGNTVDEIYHETLIYNGDHWEELK
ncbi:hypothetical protein [Butyrivibrio sp. WCE2006]|uniref:hypothetical protein n=1 Tax=Butyrivibrio sp. WCE2006 TaxID=1410611 RepID=UPI00067848D1|nr:hypothetical protein [Butyrivibrio sp. WCE2006]